MMPQCGRFQAPKAGCLCSSSSFSGLVFHLMQNMFPFSRRLVLLCAASLLATSAVSHAQIVTNSQALDSLGGAAPVAAPPTPAAPVHETAPRRTTTPARTETRRRVVEKPQTTTAQKKETSSVKNTQPAATAPKNTPATKPVTTAPAETKPAPAPAPAPAPVAKAPPAPVQESKSATPAVQPHKPPPPATIPNAPPPLPQLTPAPSDVEVHPFPVPPQPTVDLKAQGTVTPIEGGVRITFAPEAATLNPETHQAILAFGQRLSDKPHVRALIDAYSSGAVDDPSLPRRMALARGLAARSVLMNGGTPSTRIYVRVIGLPKQSAPNTPQDYIDIYQSDVEP
ncbi:OmpA family protein [Acetobacter pasteurianus]|uniref:OmpA-like domain-containing protein n=1 Tax=Acetobacter pasteurianus (strain NBRC 105184 / IFO 3283-01) TaxID=634452 RepID=C7JD85_ACEP3|nr:hypothetical protein APA01_19730 [Acetobacter pasteurianus IFO 3283-01]BAI03150.1 hypothetical protein APA03_19730 [Acetobacter pasteurianus IFO 3283-03]BAI06195.1 hypothetical protein APA07_19730 [Acetobacter pasteurianus IFO 3283-07]BAI09245.1 hypothetical protein APA22_19730 [Acetobacter pasteurianus IFO 3283-22]BAI12293.1 hypothetical protein APA26_19730 [Acetobacter pasteurianus IFO 3283-26]BAI15339.1 hypothetical protein APA32_19730 [Acetobacter pasteurianus IFO 3283-32]BAI18318.1 hy